MKSKVDRIHQLIRIILIIVQADYKPAINQELSTPSAFAALVQYAFRSSVTVVPTHSVIYLFQPASEPVRSAARTSFEHWEAKNQAPEPKSYFSSESNRSRTLEGLLRIGGSWSASSEKDWAYLRLKGGICIFRANTVNSLYGVYVCAWVGVTYFPAQAGPGNGSCCI